MSVFSSIAIFSTPCKLPVKYLLLLILFSSQVTSAQNKQKIDSLKQLLLTDADSLKLAHYSRLGEIYSSSNRDSSLYFFKQQTRIAKKNNSPFLLSTSYINQARQLRENSNEEYFFRLLDSAQLANKHLPLNQKNELLGRINQTKGLFYFRKNKYNSALIYFQKSITYFKRCNNIELINVLMSLASISQINGSAKKSLSYLLSAKSFAEKNSSNTKYMLGALYGNISVAYININNLDSSKHYLNLAEKEINTQDNVLAETQFNNLKAFFLSQEKNYIQSIEYYKKNLKTCRKLKQFSDEAYTLLNIGIQYSKNNDFMLSEQYLNQSIVISKNIDEKPILKEIYFYKTLNATKLYPKTDSVFNHLTNYNAYNDSISVKVKNEELKNLEIKYETKQNKQKIALLDNENKLQKQQIKSYTYIWLGSILVFILLLLTGHLLYQRKSRTKTLNLLLLEQKLLRTQMNPHFIFNSLTAIQNFMYKNKSHDSAQYLQKFAKLMRGILESSRSDFISLEEEIEIMRSFLDLHQLRLSDKLSYSIHTDESIDITDIQIPPMLIQPFIENAVHHGIENTNKPGHIQISISLNRSQRLEIKIEDSGEGLTTKSRSEHKSHSIQITRERITNIKKRLNKEIQLNFQDKSMFNGTTVILLIEC